MIQDQEENLVVQDLADCQVQLDQKASAVKEVFEDLPVMLDLKAREAYKA